MDSRKILEIINGGEIEKLKMLLADDIYKKELKSSAGATNRYAAMKRYFKYVDSYNGATRYPAKNIRALGETWNCFCDGSSAVLTHEDLGTLECFSGENYLDIASIMKELPVNYELIDLGEKIACAKSKGYTLKKSECDRGATAFWHYIEGYWKISLLDRAFGIINDGKPAQVYYTGAKSPLYIKTSIGIALILPVNMTDVSAVKVMIE